MNSKSVRSLFWTLFFTVFCTGCASCNNEIKMKGGIIGEYAADYIVMNQSGGDTLDVWKLKNCYVEQHGAGWRFVDGSGNAVFLGGDVKVIRMNNENAGEWDKYHEYHWEFESQTYRQKFNGGIQHTTSPALR